MECCSTHHAVSFLHECCNLENGSTHQVKFIIGNTHTNYIRTDEGHLVLLETWTNGSVQNSFPLGSSDFMNIGCTGRTLSQMGLDLCCVDTIAQEIHALCKNAMHAITIWIHISTDQIFCERCYTRRFVALVQSLLNDDDDDHVMVPASKSAIDGLMMNEETCNGESDEDCSICLENFLNEERVVHMPCTHVFHSSCIEKWLQKSNSCPLCRHKLPIEIK